MLVLMMSRRRSQSLPPFFHPANERLEVRDQELTAFGVACRRSRGVVRRDSRPMVIAAMRIAGDRWRSS